ncbi:unnamed protein product [Closterium sp. NIES-64]|nr:unnamed protein product [Closterium sp. NIES-64]
MAAQQESRIRDEAFPVAVLDDRRFRNLLPDADEAEGRADGGERRGRGEGGGTGGTLGSGEETGVEGGELGSEIGARDATRVERRLALPLEEAFLGAGLALKDEVVHATWQHRRPPRGSKTDPFLYTGLLGTAFVCLRAFHVTRSSADLDLAADITRAAAELAERQHRPPLPRLPPLLTTTHSSLQPLTCFPLTSLSLPLIHSLLAAPPQTPPPPPPTSGSYYSFFCGQPGIFALGAVVAHLQRRQHDSEKFLRRFLDLVTEALPALSQRPSSTNDIAPAGIPYELLYGRAGLLWAALFIRQHLGRAAVPDSVCRPIIEAIIAGGQFFAHSWYPPSQAVPPSSHTHTSGTPAASSSPPPPSPSPPSSSSSPPPPPSAPLAPPLMFAWHGKRYWGAAHGLAGIAHTLLLGAGHMGQVGQVGRVGEVAAAEAEEGAGEEGREAAEEGGGEAVAVLEWMVGGRLPSGNYPSSDEKRLAAAGVGAGRAAAGGADRLVQWCHGAPGVAMALAHAATVCGCVCLCIHLVLSSVVSVAFVCSARDLRYCSARDLRYCSARDLRYCSARDLRYCSARDLRYCSARDLRYCSARDLRYCSARDLRYCSARDLRYCSARDLRYCSARDLRYCSARDLRYCSGLSSLHMLPATASTSHPSRQHLLAAAVAAGEVAWQRGLLRKMGLCHGIAGNAYAFLSLHRAASALHATSLQETTTSALPPPSTHLHRAHAFAAFLLAHRQRLAHAALLHCGDRPFSLMEGLGGVACLFLHLVRPEDARFPGFEL